MTLQQLEYIVAVDNYRHFGKAAAHCFITQPSLSMQIQKLESELKISIFSRNSYPIVPTELGTLIIEQARKVLSEAGGIMELIQHQKDDMEGHIKIGIIPTLAPYLLPIFLNNFIKKYPRIKISISELTTEKIIRRLKNGTLDAGIMATPLNEKELIEEILFYEEFIAYVNKKEKIFTKRFLLPTDIDVQKLWLLEEGHCLRSQVLNLCELQKSAAFDQHFEYETGSIETLKRFVEQNQGITLLPELATLDLSANKKKMLRYFKQPAPAREISMVTLKSFVKRKLIELLRAEIVQCLPASIMRKKDQRRIDIS